MRTIERSNGADKYGLQQVGLMYYLSVAWAVLMKDIRCELRARQAISAVLLFAVTSTIAVSFVLGPRGNNGTIASALLWIVLYFSAMSGLSRSFVHEDEMHTSATIKLAARPNAVYLGKLAFNWGMLLVLQVITVPMFLLLMGCEIKNWSILLAILGFGGLGLSAGATMSAAMVAKASVRGALFSVICFPLLVPVLAAAVQGSAIAVGGGNTSTAWSDVRILCYYCGIVITASLMLFRFIWED